MGIEWDTSSPHKPFTHALSLEKAANALLQKPGGQLALCTWPEADPILSLAAFVVP